MQFVAWLCCQNIKKQVIQIYKVSNQLAFYLGSKLDLMERNII